MTKEEKQLLLITLCGMLPYGVIVQENDGVNENDNKLLNIDMFDRCINYDYIIDDIKPYLRPMSSMTKEEREEIEIFICDEWFIDDDKATKVDSEGFIEFLSDYDCSGIYPEFCGQYVDWLLSHHFDFRGLIEKSLAIVAPEGMYKTE